MNSKVRGTGKVYNAANIKLDQNLSQLFNMQFSEGVLTRVA
jgi:hypothetical protein